MTTQAEKQRRIKMRIDYTPEYRIARRMIEQMSADYAIDVRTIFTNREKTCVTIYNPDARDPYVIRLGYQFIDNVYRDRKRGSARTTHDHFFGPAVFGLEAIYRIAIHEFAHVVQIRQFFSDPDVDDYRIAQHGWEWISVVNELTELYPFETMEPLARPWTDPQTQETEA